MNKQKRVLAVHDISDIGRCSLTVALPVISACGLETAVLPTAILSTHTGGFEGYTYRDLSEDIIPVTNHWKSLDIKFDAVYSGFLGSFEQLDIFRELFSQYKKDGSAIIVDPVLGDNGKLYPVFGSEFVSGMRELCRIADIITPNLTEACLLTGRPYCPDCEPGQLTALLEELSAYTARYAVLTGVKSSDELGAAVFDKHTGVTDIITNIQVDGIFHGTGDVFASAMTGAYVRGRSIKESVRIAVDFTLESILHACEHETEYRYGVAFEEALPTLIKLLNLI